MRAILLYAALLTGLTHNVYALANVTGWCEIGGRVTISSAAVASAPVSRNFMQSFPGCTVNVFITGSGGSRSTLFSNNTGTSLTNPFTANTLTGFFSFYVTDGYVDIQLSGGGLASPYTIGSVNVSDTYYTQSGTGAVASRKVDKLNDTVSVRDFGVKCDGTTNDYAAIVAAHNASIVRKAVLQWPAGICTYSTPLVITDNLTFWQGQGTRLKYTGTSTTYALTMDGHASSNGYQFILRDFVIDGNGLATNGLRLWLTVGGDISDVRVTNVSGAGFVCHGCTTLAINNPIISSHAEAFVTVPANGILFEPIPTVFGLSGDVTVSNMKIEGVSSYGVDINQGAQGTTFIGGTSESNGSGMRIRGGGGAGHGGLLTTIIGVDMESNTTNDLLLDNSQYTNAINSIFASTNSISIVASPGNLFQGDYVGKMTLDSNSLTKFNTLIGVNFTAAGANLSQLTNNGSYTTMSGVTDQANFVPYPDTYAATALTFGTTARAGFVDWASGNRLSMQPPFTLGTNTNAAYGSSTFTKNLTFNLSRSIFGDSTLEDGVTGLQFQALSVLHNIPAAVNNAYQRVYTFQAGGDGTLGPADLIVDIKPSATHANRRVSLEAGDNSGDIDMELNRNNARVLVGGATSTSTAKLITHGGLADDGVLQAALGADANGTWRYCTDCTVTTPGSCTNVTTVAACTCTGSGNGALAKRINSVWLCN